MTKPKIKIHDLITNEIIERDMDSDELKQWESEKAESEAKAQALVDAVQAKVELLNRLGITAEEAKLLLS